MIVSNKELLREMRERVRQQSLKREDYMIPAANKLITQYRRGIMTLADLVTQLQLLDLETPWED